MTNPDVLDELERWCNDHADSVTLAISCGKIRSLIADARELATLKARIEALRKHVERSRGKYKWGVEAALSIVGGRDHA